MKSRGCWRFRRATSLMAAGVLEGAEREAFVRHVSQCPGCASAWAEAQCVARSLVEHKETWLDRGSGDEPAANGKRPSPGALLREESGSRGRGRPGSKDSVMGSPLSVEAEGSVPMNSWPKPGSDACPAGVVPASVRSRVSLAPSPPTGEPIDARPARRADSASQSRFEGRAVSSEGRDGSTLDWEAAVRRLAQGDPGPQRWLAGVPEWWLLIWDGAWAWHPRGVGLVCMIWFAILGLRVSMPEVAVPRSQHWVVSVMDPWVALRSMPVDYRRLMVEGEAGLVRSGARNGGTALPQTEGERPPTRRSPESDGGRTHPETGDSNLTGPRLALEFRIDRNELTRTLRPNGQV